MNRNTSSVLAFAGIVAVAAQAAALMSCQGVIADDPAAIPGTLPLAFAASAGRPESRKSASAAPADHSQGWMTAGRAADATRPCSRS
jgi:hypothetical protein